MELRIAEPVIKKTGIPKMVVSKLPEEITVKYIEDNLATFVSKQNANAIKIQKYLDFTDGTKQGIDQKERPYRTGGGANEKIKENHAYAMVSFKQGFLLGEKREFALKSDVINDDLIYLERFLTDCDFYSQDLDLKYNIYATGIGTTYISPRTDIIRVTRRGMAKFSDKSEGYDVDNNAPFVYEVVDSRKNGVVYTSKVGMRGDKTLFCFSLGKTGENDEFDEVSVWTHGWSGVFDNSSGNFKLKKNTKKNALINYPYLPLVEHSINSSRLGIIELTETSLNAINLIASSSLDNLLDLANHIIAFLDLDVKPEQVRDMFINGSIAIPPSGGKSPRIEKIALELNYEQVNKLFEQRLTRMYDIAGVPLATASVTSGGDTGQARLLGGGWTNAFTIIKKDILALERADREILKRMIAICKQNPKNEVDEISASQIEIKYNITMSDNLLIKTQSLQNLFEASFPLEDILRAIPIVSDVKTVAQRWEKRLEQAKAEEIDREVDKTQEVEKP